MTARRLLHPGAAMAALALAACTNMSGLSGSSRYSCAAPKGVSCNSVSGNYANAIRNNLPGQRSASGSAAAKTPGNAIDPAAKAPLRSASNIPIASAADTTPPLALRSQGRYLRLWIKPWEDIDGDLFDQTYIYVQIDQGRWQIEHVQQAIRDHYAPLSPPPGTSTAGNSTDTSATPASATSAASLPVARPSGSSGASGFPLLNNPPAVAGAPAGGAP